MRKIYLAGPDVFSNDPRGQGSRLKNTLLNYGLDGMFPFDNEPRSLLRHAPPTFVKAQEIYQANIKMIQECDAVLANLEPFRGPSVDPGTAFEIGFAKALGKTVVGYNSPVQEYKDRVTVGDGRLFPGVEDFGLPENLMIALTTLPAFTGPNSLIEACKYLASVLPERTNPWGSAIRPPNDESYDPEAERSYDGEDYAELDKFKNDPPQGFGSRR